MDDDGRIEKVFISSELKWISSKCLVNWNEFLDKLLKVTKNIVAKLDTWSTYGEQ